MATPRRRPGPEDDGASVIHDAARNQNWQRVLELCTTHPQRASYVEADGTTALHLACLHQCHDTRVFEALIQAFPGALLKQESKGMVPLHYACRFHASADVMHNLLHTYPGKGRASSKMHDRKGRTPLYYAEKENAPSDVVDMIRDLDPGASVQRVDDDASDDEEPPPAPQPQSLGRQTSFHRALLESSSRDFDAQMAAAMAASTSDAYASSSNIQDDEDWKEAWLAAGGEEPTAGGAANDFGDREILEQFRFMAEHEACRRLKEETGFDMERHQQQVKMDKVTGVSVPTKKNLLQTKLPRPMRVTNASMPKLQEPVLPPFRPDPVFRGKMTQLEPEVTPGNLVVQDEEVPPEEQVLQCLGCQKKLRVKQKAMLVSCPNCSIKSPAYTTSHLIDV